MDAAQMREAFKDAFDQALVFHGYTEYMRDYELVVQLSADPRTGIPTTYTRYVFVNCVAARVESALPPESWSTSLDDRLIGDDGGVDVSGYVWGVKWQELYPGLELLPESEETKKWAASVGIPFYSASIEANAHTLHLVFSDLRLAHADEGYVPFTVGRPFWDGKIPL